MTDTSNTDPNAPASFLDKASAFFSGFGKGAAARFGFAALVPGGSMLEGISDVATTPTETNKVLTDEAVVTGTAIKDTAVAAYNIGAKIGNYIILLLVIVVVVVLFGLYGRAHG